MKYIQGAWYAFQEQQKKLDYHIETNADLAKLVLELQGRIDEASYHLDFNHDNDKDIAISILKGNKDEN